MLLAWNIQATDPASRPLTLRMPALPLGAPSLQPKSAGTSPYSPPPLLPFPAPF